MNKVNYFGFKMVTDKMAIGDPTAFEPQTYSIPKGDWAAIVSYTPHNRIQSVRVQHKTFKGERTAPINTIMVDTGQIVFCDKQLFQNDELTVMMTIGLNLPKMDWEQHTPFYNMCSFQSLTDACCGSILNGFVTSTGGDGTYSLLGEFKDNSEEYEKNFGRLYTAFSIQFE